MNIYEYISLGLVILFVLFLYTILNPIMRLNSVDKGITNINFKRLGLYTVLIIILILISLVII